jgi:C4-dicarboxylate transporter DctM subunit
VFTPTEAAAVAAVYAFFAAVVIYRDLKITDVPQVLLDSGRVTVMLMFIICNAFLFGHVLTTAQIPQEIARMITEANLAPWHFLLVVNIILLVAGNFMDPAPIVLITAPILFPTAVKLGIDPIHLGVMYVVNMEIGLVTPPVGLNLFVASGITGQPLMSVVRAALPWLMVLLGFLIVVTYIPEVSLWLPNLLFGKPV